MSIESRWTIGAMASKKASAPSPVSAPIASASARRGQRAGGDDDAVPVRRRQAGDLAALERDRADAPRTAASTAAREAVAVDRERAAGRHLVGVGAAHDRASPARASRDAARRRRWSRRRRSGTSSSRRARRAGSVRCAAVARSGRISCRTTGTPASAACQAASEPARPPPMTWMGRMGALLTKL